VCFFSKGIEHVLPPSFHRRGSVFAPLCSASRKWKIQRFSSLSQPSRQPRGTPIFSFSFFLLAEVDLLCFVLAGHYKGGHRSASPSSPPRKDCVYFLGRLRFRSPGETEEGCPRTFIGAIAPLKRKTTLPSLPRTFLFPSALRQGFLRGPGDFFYEYLERIMIFPSAPSRKSSA